MGYSEVQNGYRIFNPKTYKTHVARNVKFLETNFLEHSVAGTGEDFLQWPEKWGGDLEDPPSPDSDLEDSETSEDTEEEADHPDRASVPPTSLSPSKALHPAYQGNALLEREDQIPERLLLLPQEAETATSVASDTNRGVSAPMLSSPPDTDSFEHVPETDPEETPVRRSGRTIIKPSVFGYDKLGESNASARQYQGYLVTAEDQLTYKAAISGPEKEEWEAAIQQEITSLEENHTWTIQPLPTGRKAIGCRWIFKKKDQPDGGIRYKARLVAKGYTQMEGLDFFETYAPVLKYQSLKMMLVLEYCRYSIVRIP